MSIVEIRGGPVTVPKLLKKSRHEIARQCVEALTHCDTLRDWAKKTETENVELRALVRDLMENDPDELAADGGVTVLDV